MEIAIEEEQTLPPAEVDWQSVAEPPIIGTKTEFAQEPQKMPGFFFVFL
jgi:hypothetical protein